MKTSKLNRISVNLPDNQVNDQSDFLTGQLLEHFNTNPLGRLLKIIASLPEVRPEKLAHARRLVRKENTDLDIRLDAVLDKVLEELLTDSN